MVNKILSPTCRFSKFLSLLLVFILTISATYSPLFTNADEGYIDGDKIVINGITYENKESAFSKIETYSANSAGFSYQRDYSDQSDYSETQDYPETQETYIAEPDYSQYNIADGKTVIPEIGSTDGKDVTPKMLCETPSSEDCVYVWYLTTPAVGEPVKGTFYKQTPLWQKIIYDDEVYYVPVDDIVIVKPSQSTVVTNSTLVASNGWNSFMSPSKLFKEQENLNDKIIKARKRASAITNYMERYHNIHKYSALDTCTHVYKNADGSTKPYVEMVTVLNWCKQNNISRESIEKEFENKSKMMLEKEIYKNMNRHHLDDKFNELDTCKWAYWDKNGKVKSKDKLQYVISWCKIYGISEDRILMRNNIKNEQISAPKLEKINRTYYAITGYEKDDDTPLKFKLEKATTFDSYESSNNKNTYILIHGWVSSPDTWADDMAKTIYNQDQKAQILLLDWRDIAYQELAGGIPEPYTIVSKWTKPIVQQIAQPLVDWGIDNSNATIIGHSLGTFIALELTEYLEGLNKEKGGKINTVYLDPANSVGGYILEFGKNPEKMDSFNSSGICLLGKGSKLGSKKLMKTTREKYFIEYNDPNDNSAISENSEDIALDFVIDDIADSYADLIKRKTLKKVVKVVGKEIIVEVYGVWKGRQTLIGAAKAVIQGKALTLPCLATKGVMNDICVATLGDLITGAYNNIVNNFYKKHIWVPQTYNQIIQTPFVNDYLDIHEKNNFYSESKIFDGADGIVYTEKEQSQNIKYLKVENNYTPNNYTLYGTSANNSFECMESVFEFSNKVWQDCIMYGGGGNDIFKVDTYETFRVINDFIVKDFKDNNDADKITIENYDKKSFGKTILEAVMLKFNGKMVPAIEVSCDACKNDDALAEAMNRVVYLEESDRYSFEEVEEWVKDAINEDGKYDEDDLKKLPIYIKK